MNQILSTISDQDSYQLEENLLPHILRCACQNDVKSIRKIADEHQDRIKYLFGPLYKLEYLFNYFLLMPELMRLKHYYR